MVYKNRNLSFFKVVVSLFAAGSFSSLFAVSSLPNCGADTLANYISNTQNPPASGGCAIGVLDYYNMAYTAGTNAPATSAINVTPNGQGFSFGPVSAAAGQTVQFEIDYDIFIDPAPIITGDSLGLDVNGDVTVTEYFCNDLPLNVGSGLSGGGATCLGSVPATDSLTVGNDNQYPQNASVTFTTPVVKFQEVAVVFTLNGGTGGASFQGLDTASVVVTAPEPASAGFALAGLLTLAGGYKLRKRHNRSM